MVLMVILAIVAGVILIYFWVKLVNFIFNKPIQWLESRKARLNKTDNPYVMAHRKKFLNDKMYDEYLVWLSQNGGDAPFDKMKTEEEKLVENQIKSYLG